MNLKKEMQSVGVTAYRLSKISGVSQSTICKINRGLQVPKVTTMQKLKNGINKFKKQ